MRNIGDLINWFMWKNIKKLEDKNLREFNSVDKKIR
jgi:hypothetical protein